MPTGPLDLAVPVLVLGQQDRARGSAVPCLWQPRGSSWGSACGLAPGLRGQCRASLRLFKVGRVTFWESAQDTLGCPCHLLLAQGTALAGTVCFRWVS